MICPIKGTKTSIKAAPYKNSSTTYAPFWSNLNNFYFSNKNPKAELDKT